MRRFGVGGTQENDSRSAVSCKRLLGRPQPAAEHDGTADDANPAHAPSRHPLNVPEVFSEVRWSSEAAGRPADADWVTAQLERSRSFSPRCSGARGWTWPDIGEATRQPIRKIFGAA